MAFQKRQVNMWHICHAKRSASDMATVSADSRRAEGSYSPEPLPAHPRCPLSFKHDSRQSSQKLSDVEMTWCTGDIVNEKERETSVEHSPGPETAHMPLTIEPMVFPWALPLLLCELQYMIGLRWCLYVVSGCCGGMEGSPSPEPSTVCHSPLLGFKLDRRLLWKPPDVMEIEWHIRDVIKSSDGMSRAYSHGHVTVLIPFTPEPKVTLQAPHYPHSLHKLRDMEPIKQCADRMEVINMAQGRDCTYLSPHQITMLVCWIIWISGITDGFVGSPLVWRSWDDSLLMSSGLEVTGWVVGTHLDLRRPSRHLFLLLILLPAWVVEYDASC